jgi:hypothetical protein
MSMFVAHTAPSGGPGHLLDLSEYLTAPLFATLIGMGTWLGWTRLDGRAHRSGRFLVGVVIRSVGLIATGLLLERLNVQVYIVLVHLGVLTMLAALLVRVRSSVIGAAGILFAVLGSELPGHVALTHLPLLDDSPFAPYPLTFRDYGVTHLLAWACLGIILARRSELTHGFLGSRSRNPGENRSTWRLVRGDTVLTAGTLALAAGIWVARAAGLITIYPYQRNLAEMAFDALLCTAAVCGSAVLVHLLRGPIIRAIATAGAMTLTLYVAQILVLAAFVALNPGVSDDSWPMLIGLVVGSLAFTVLWRALVRTGAFARGPLEGVIGLGVRAVEKLWPEPSYTPGSA